MQQITPEHLIELQRNHEDLLLVNTLPPESYEQTAIHGSINIPQDSPDFVDEVKRRLNGEDKPVVVYCASSSCDSSVKAAEKLDEAGVKQVLEFTDGYQGWKERLEHEHAATGS